MNSYSLQQLVSRYGWYNLISYSKTLKYITFLDVKVVVEALMMHLFESEPTIYNKYLFASLLIMKFVSYMCTCLLFVVTILEIFIYVYLLLLISLVVEKFDKIKFYGFDPWLSFIKNILYICITRSFLSIFSTFQNI